MSFTWGVNEPTSKRDEQPINADNWSLLEPGASLGSMHQNDGVSGEKQPVGTESQPTVSETGGKAWANMLEWTQVFSAFTVQAAIQLRELSRLVKWCDIKVNFTTWKSYS